MRVRGWQGDVSFEMRAKEIGMTLAKCMTPRERKTLVDATSPTTNYTSRRTPRKWQ